MSDDRPHSERYFTDARDHWWHADYLDLLRRRHRLDAAATVLEVGAGQGHFARALAPHLAPGARVTLVDREPRSLAIAAAREGAWRAATGATAAFAYAAADAEALPFADGAFDAVVCQTLLIHVADRDRVMAELVRVCRPGGLLLLVEPNNAATLQLVAARGPGADVGAALAVARLHLRCTAGKAALGLGWNNAGVHLPALLSGLDGVSFSNNDRAWRLAPPYADPQEQAAIADLRRDHAEGVCGWPRAEAARYYLAGGGSADELEADYGAALRAQAEVLAEIDAGRYTALVAFAGLIGVGRKPAAAPPLPR